MIEFEKEIVYPYMEVPEDWIPIIGHCIDEINLVLSVYNLPSDYIKYEQVKEKFGNLRIYYFIPAQIEDGLTDLDYLFIRKIESLVDTIVRDAEDKVKLLVK